MGDVEDLTKSLRDLRAGQGLTAVSLTTDRHPVLMRHLGTDDPYEGVEILSDLARKLGNTREAKVLRYVMAIDVEDRAKNAAARRKALISYDGTRRPIIPVSERTLFSDEKRAIDQLVQLILRYSKARTQNGAGTLELTRRPSNEVAVVTGQQPSTELVRYDPDFASRYIWDYLQGLDSREWPDWAHDDVAYANMDASLYKQRHTHVEMENDGDDDSPFEAEWPDWLDWLIRLLGWRNGLLGDLILPKLLIVLYVLLALMLISYGAQESDHFFHTHFLEGK